MFRQGDVMIVPVEEVPKGLKRVPLENGRVILAHGEVTGHAHAVLGDVELLARDLAEMEGRFLRVEEEAQVVHEEHATVTLPSGNYRVLRQREYQDEAPAYVAD